MLSFSIVSALCSISLFVSKTNIFFVFLFVGSVRRSICNKGTTMPLGFFDVFYSLVFPGPVDDMQDLFQHAAVRLHEEKLKKGSLSVFFVPSVLALPTYVGKFISECI